MSAGTPLWIDALVSLLLVTGGAFCVVGAIGLVRFRDVYMRMHPATLPYTMGTWSIALASIVYFSASQERFSVQPWAIVVLLAIGAPVATVFLARAALFRLRRAQRAEPAPAPTGALDAEAKQAPD